MSRAIEVAIANDDWECAQKLIEAELVQDPQNHWLLTRLGLTYYERHDYPRALELEEEALSLAPNCPLVLWDYAGTLEMLDRPTEAASIYQRIIDRGIESLAWDECGEGLSRARGLLADSLYRLGHCHAALGNVALATELLQKHLNQRGPGCHSIYDIKKVRKELRNFATVEPAHG